MRDDGTVVERRATPACAVDKLVRDDQVANLDVRLERPDGSRGDDAAYAKGLERPDVGAVVDHVRWKLVMLAVPGKERDLASRDLAKGQEVGWGSVGGFHLDILCVVQQGIESGTTNDPDLSALFHGCSLLSMGAGIAWYAPETSISAKPGGQNWTL